MCWVCSQHLAIAKKATMSDDLCFMLWQAYSGSIDIHQRCFSLLFVNVPWHAGHQHIPASNYLDKQQAQHWRTASNKMTIPT
jgi:hypothetical protein